MSKTIASTRLLKEHQSLQKHPLVNANASPFNDDLFTWKLIVVGEAPYDFPIRIHLDYANDYPNVAPKAYFETHMPFVGGASIIADNGLQSVCLNIFGNFAFVHTEWKNQQSGWTPAYTIETIVTSIQGLMMEDMLSKDKGEIAKARKAAMNFKCKVTGHDGSDRSKYWPSIDHPEHQNTQASAKKQEGAENSASTSSLCATVKTATVLSDAQLQLKAESFDALTDTDFLSQRETYLQQQFSCYVTKDIPESKLLGFGITIDGGKIKFFTSPCELMSYEAFYDFNVRQSTTNKPIQAWLPLFTPLTPHWADISKYFYKGMEMLMKQAALPCPKQDLTPFHIGVSIMNSLVVEVMNSSNQLTANDKFIDGYFAIFKLIRAHMTHNEHFSTVIRAFVDSSIAGFLKSAQGRTKQVIPNLGDFILYPLFSEKYQWKDLASAYLEEVDARRVFWYVQGTYSQRPPCPELKNPNVKPRAVKVFNATATSRNLVCYQKQFATVAAKILKAQHNEENCTTKPLSAFRACTLEEENTNTPQPSESNEQLEEWEKEMRNEDEKKQQQKKKTTTQNNRNSSSHHVDPTSSAAAVVTPVHPLPAGLSLNSFSDAFQLGLLYQQYQAEKNNARSSSEESPTTKRKQSATTPPPPPTLQTSAILSQAAQILHISPSTMTERCFTEDLPVWISSLDQQAQKKQKEEQVLLTEEQKQKIHELKMEKIKSLLVQESQRTFYLSDGVKKEIKAMHQEITNMKNWAEYYKWLEVPMSSDLDQLFVKALQQSLASGYHQNNQNQR